MRPIKEIIPVWPLKIAAKLILRYIPMRHQLLRSLRIFRHGEMDNYEYALKIFKLHFAHWTKLGKSEKEFVCLEMGPGDSLASALIAKAYGASKSYHVDVDGYATKDITVYKRIAQGLGQSGLQNVADISNLKTVDEMLLLCNSEYITTGLDGLRAIPDESIDFIWSHSVLEHVRKKEFFDTIKETHRILKKDGYASHNVDLMDHLEKSINNLRFSEKLWESNFFADAGFYTNRLRYSEHIKLMEQAGFIVVDTQQGQHEQIPLPRKKLHKDFQGMSENDLRTRTYSVLLKK